MSKSKSCISIGGLTESLKHIIVFQEAERDVSSDEFVPSFVKKVVNYDSNRES